METAKQLEEDESAQSTAEVSEPPEATEQPVDEPLDSPENVSWRVAAYAAFSRGQAGVDDWNRRRRDDPSEPVLDNADLRRAKLTEVDLSRCSLRYARLDQAILLSARFEGADLRNASMTAVQLQGARLGGARLHNVNLERANLRWANLAGADLRNANLSEAAVDPCDFSGADLEGAQFSTTALDEFMEAVERLEKAATHPRAIFTALLGFCLFSGITAVTAAPVALITRQGSVKIPLLDSEVTVRAFFFIAPAVAVGLLCYLAVHLAQLHQLAKALPARFPDGTLTMDKVTPWLQAAIPVHDLPRPHGAIQRHQPHPSSRLLGVLTRWVVPWTATVMLWALVQCRSAPDLWLHFALTAGIWITAAVLWRRERRIASGAFWAAAALVAGMLAATGVVIAKVTESAPNRGPRANEMPFPLRARGMDLASDVLEQLNLAGSDFSHAKMSGSAFNDVDLRGALLIGADLKGLGAKCTNLRGARLNRAELSNAWLSCSSLRSAQLRGAILTGATLSWTDLRAADLTGATLSTETRFVGVLCDAATRWPASAPAVECRSDPTELNAQCRACPFD